VPFQRLSVTSLITKSPINLALMLTVQGLQTLKTRENPILLPLFALPVILPFMSKLQNNNEEIEPWTFPFVCP
jgi:ABC-type transport system involved in cytochrome c biogenesis permease component